MTRPLILLAAALFVGCDDSAVGVDPLGPGDGSSETPDGRQPVTSMSGNQSGSEDILVCHEASRELITDASVAARGADTAPAEYVSRLAQTYTGEADFGAGLVPVDVVLTADPDTLAFVVYADEDWEEGDPIPFGEDDMCDDRYEMGVVVHVTAADALDELVSTTAWGWHDSQALYVAMAVAPADVTGNHLPTAFDLSASPEAYLGIGFESHSSHSLTVTWAEGPWEPGEPDEPIHETYGPISLTTQ